MDCLICGLSFHGNLHNRETTSPRTTSSHSPVIKSVFAAIQIYRIHPT
jgi:hypothetical protein